MSTFTLDFETGTIKIGRGKAVPVTQGRMERFIRQVIDPVIAEDMIKESQEACLHAQRV